MSDSQRDTQIVEFQQALLRHLRLGKINEIPTPTAPQHSERRKVIEKTKVSWVDRLKEMYANARQQALSARNGLIDAALVGNEAGRTPISRGQQQFKAVPAAAPIDDRAEPALLSAQWVRLNQLIARKERAMRRWRKRIELMEKELERLKST